MLTSWNKLSRQSRQIELGVLLLAIFSTCTLRAQPSPGHQVSLYLTAEQNGNLVQGLGQKDFRLFQDGQPQSFRLEKPETPASVALLVEDSQSSEYYYWDDLQEALGGFLQNAKAGNWYAFARFSHDLHVDVDFTKKIGELREGFAGLGHSMWNETDTYDAIYQMLDKMGRLPGRKVLIFVGSGLDSFSAHTLEDVRKKLESVNVTVYVVTLGTAFRGYYEPYMGESSRMSLLEARAFLQMLADESGGQAWFPDEQGAYPDIMQGIFQSLANQYRLVYELQVPHNDKFHPVKVEAFTLKDDQRHDYKVRVRKGWRF